MTLQELKDKISIITNETKAGANTARRIGSTMQDIASFVPSYPVVTVTDNFNIDAQPNTFYNIKNSGADSVNINIDSDKYLVDEQEKLTIFTWDTMMEDLENSDLDMLNYSIITGHYIKEDNTHENYKYSSHQLLEMLFTDEDEGMTISLLFHITSYFSDDIKTGNDINWWVKLFLIKVKYTDEAGNILEEFESDFTEEFGQDIIIPITNILVPTDNTEDLARITAKEEYQSEMPFADMPTVFIEVENDNSEFSHKYEVFGLIQLMIGLQYVYTNESLPNTTDIYAVIEGEDESEDEVGNLSEVVDIKFVKNIALSGCEVANEYVFNINSPANVTFNQSIKWNNGSEPDLSQKGTYTISLLNGVGCFTFVE